MANHILKRLQLGLQRRWRESLRDLLSVWALIWLFVESLAFYSTTFRASVEPISGHIIIWGLLVGVVYALVRLPVTTQVVLTMPGTNTKVTVRYGDLFGGWNNLGIAVSEFFESEIGRPVAPNSVQGQFIAKVFGGNASQFDTEVDAALRDIPAIREAGKQEGKALRYPIGTTAMIAHGTRKYFLFALSRTETTTLKAACDVLQLLEALRGLWTSVRTLAGNEPISIPLVGGGLSGVGIPSSQLLRVLLLSLFVETKKSPITTSIEIVLHEDQMEEIDLELLEKEWK